VLIKFHGSYQQEDRDQRQERKRDGEALGDWATRRVGPELAPI